MLRVLLVCVAAILAPCSHANGILVRSAELVPGEEGYALEAKYDVGLTATLEEALVRGLALHFATEFEVVLPRWWTLSLWNRSVTRARIDHKLSYNALTRQYRLSFGSLHQGFDALSEALAVLGRVRLPMAVPYDELEPGVVYEATLRLRLDTSLLPKPLQIDALASREWNLASDWYRWTFTR